MESRQGYGTIVGGRPEVIERKDRRGQETLERDESQVGRLVQVGMVSVPARVASFLGVPGRTKVLMRRLVVEEDGEPVELVSAYFPASLVEGTERSAFEPLSSSSRE